MNYNYLDAHFTLDDARISLKAALPQLIEVVDHVVVRPVHLGLACLHQGLQHMVQVLPELGPGCESHVSKHGEDLRLDAPVHGIIPEVAEQHLHHLIRPGHHPATKGSANVSHQTHSSVTYLLVIQDNFRDTIELINDPHTWYSAVFLNPISR